jgi:protein O-GlcNAc transferase
MAFGGDNAESYYDEGVTALMKGDVAQAVTFFQRAIQLDRTHYAAYHQLGKCYLRQGQTQQAVETFHFVIRNKPNLIPPRLDLGFALLDQGKVDAAEPIFEEISRIKPDNGRASLGLAQCAFQKGKWDAVILFAQAAAELGGAHFNAFLLLGRAATFAGRYDVAKTALDRANALIVKHIEANPEQPEGHYLRGEVQFVLQEFSKAAECYESAAANAVPGRRYTAYDAHFTILDILGKQGVCLQHMGRLDSARFIGQRMLEIDPNSATGAMLMNNAPQEKPQ